MSATTAFTSNSQTNRGSGDRKLVLVTGATGYMASCLVKQLAEAGDYRLRCTVRSLENNQKLEALKQVLKGCKTQPEFVQADLLQSADQWKEIVKGCDYVLHTASPFPMLGSKDEDSVIIKPAVDGTVSVLEACADLGTVKRVVITSSAYAIFENGRGPEKIFTEADWPDVSKLTDPYAKSKPLAEKAAWDFANSLPGGRKLELATVQPGLIVGPPVMNISSTSIDVCKNIMTGAWPAVPPASFPVVDVRDVGLAHIRAMTAPEAAGNRHLLSSECYWMKNIAQDLAGEFNAKGYNISTEEGGQRGDPIQVDNTRMRKALGVEPRPVKQSLVEMGEALIKFGIVPKPEQ